MMTEEIVPEQEVVLEQVSRDDDMDLGHGTAATELDRSHDKVFCYFPHFNLFFWCWFLCFANRLTFTNTRYS